MLVYTPAAGYLGADSFTYTVSDGHGETATGTVSISVIAPVTVSNWPAHVFAPYVDMTLYPTYNLVTAMQIRRHQVLHARLHHGRFQQRAGVGRLCRVRGQRRVFRPVDPHADQRRFARSAATSACRLAAKRGRSWPQVVTNVQTLTADYQQVITAYGLTHIDFDIEGAAVADNASIDRRSQAIAALAASRHGCRQDARCLVHTAGSADRLDGQWPVCASVCAQVRREDLDGQRHGDGLRRRRGPEPGRADGHLRHRFGEERVYPVARPLRHDAHHQPALGDGRRHADDRRQ